MAPTAWTSHVTERAEGLGFLTPRHDCKGAHPWPVAASASSGHSWLNIVLSWVRTMGTGCTD